MKKPKGFFDQVRAAVDSAGVSRNRICQEANIDRATMSRFMNGKCGISSAALERLAAVLGLDIVARKATGQEKRTRKGR